LGNIWGAPVDASRQAHDDTVAVGDDDDDDDGGIKPARRGQPARTASMTRIACVFIVAVAGLSAASDGKSEHWLGASDRRHEGSWTWMDGSTVTMGMPFWAFDQPDNFRGQEHCLEFSHTKSGYFNDQQCSREVSFVCQAPMSIISWPRQDTIHILESLKRNSLH
ncbi:perlucin-like, partial [Eriocheir sinensis]|uniref:perlucin-like n=1 Tax=Eriocheir sinensis TaxID=95602 RepID=UPI0021CA1B6F